MAIEASKAHVGQYCEVIPFTGGEKVRGLIIGTTPDKRVNKVLMRIEVEESNTDENGVTTVSTKVIHKVYQSEALVLLDEWNEERRNQWLSRAEATKMTPEEKLIDLQKKIAKAEETIKKSEENIDQWSQDIAVIESVLAKAADETPAEAPAEAADDMM